MANDFPYNEDWHDYSDDLTSKSKNTEKRIFTINVSEINPEDIEKYIKDLKKRMTEDPNDKTDYYVKE